MRRISFLIVFMAGLTAHAQNPAFNLTVFSDNYVDLEASISLNNGAIWDDPSYIIPIGFNFQLFGQNMEFLSMADFGLGGILTGPVTSEIVQVFVPYPSDIIDAGYDLDSSMSNISYKIDGNFPNRIFKLEWNNCGFYNEVNDLGTNSNRVNFQMWLYEGTFDIEVRFGPNNINNSELVHDGNPGPWTGFIENYNFNTDVFENMWYTQNMGENIVLGQISSVDELPGSPALSSNPTDGMVFRFATGIVDVNEYTLPEVKVYPNVIDQTAFVYSPGNFHYKIFSLTGKEVSNGRLQSGRQELDMSQFPNGIYLMSIQSDFGNQTVKLVKR